MIINFIHIPKNGGTSIKTICGKKNKTILIYNGHSTNVYKKRLINQLIVIRNPIKRFISSVYYALQKWSHEPQIKYLISKSIDSPEKWLEIWRDSTHPEYKNLMREMLNKNHYIGNHLYKYKWTYTPQCYWVNNPKFIIIMDYFDNEIEYFKKKYKVVGNIDKKYNSTNHIDDKLSEKSIKFLRDFYKNDFELYEKYKNMIIENRI